MRCFKILFAKYYLKYFYIIFLSNNFTDLNDFEF